MTKRYYYDDPYAAAYMYHRHGMVMADGEGRPLEWCYEFSCFYLPEGDGTSWEGYFYVHPDSIHLLEPREGDLTVRGEPEVYSYLCYETKEFPQICNREQGVRPRNACGGNWHVLQIIQRDDKQFFWPKEKP